MPINRSQRRKIDPTAQGAARKKCSRKIIGKLRSAKRRVKRLIDPIQYERKIIRPIANSRVVYDYRITPAEQAEIARQIRQITDDELEAGEDRPPPAWYLSQDFESAYRQGTVEEINRINGLIAAAILAGLIRDPFVTEINPDAFMKSAQYDVGLRRLIVRNHNNIKTLSKDVAARVIRQINDDLAGGVSPSEIGKGIGRKFDVAESSAQRIANTEINRAYNDGKMNATKDAATRTGRRTGVLHFSALLPTTRAHHAARHGNTYTVEDQEAWWDQGANRINCHCSVSTVFIGDDGSVEQTEDLEKIKKEREFFS